MTALSPLRATGPLEGTVALVTGGGRGLGRVLAQAPAAEGAAVGVIGRSADDLAGTRPPDRGRRRAGRRRPCGRRRRARDLPGRSGAVPPARARRRARQQRRDQRPDRPDVGGPLGRLVAHVRGQPPRARRMHPPRPARHARAPPGTDREPHEQRRRLPLARRVRLLGVEGGGGQAHGEPRRRDAARRRERVQLHPGLLPIGLSEAVLATDADPDTPEGRVAGWARRQFAEGNAADPERAAEMVVQLASGRADRLSGRHLSVDDDLEFLLGRADDVREQDLCTLRVRTLRPDAEPVAARAGIDPLRSSGAVATAGVAVA